MLLILSTSGTPPPFGTIPSWLTLAALLIGLWRITRGGAGSAVAELTAANKVLTESLHETREKLGAEIRDLRVENAELRARTDVSEAMRPMLASMHEAEKAAVMRHGEMMRMLDGTLKVLGIISRQFGEDDDISVDGTAL